MISEAHEILERDGPGRITPPCPHYDRCGGCQLQHLDQPTYQSWKEGAVRDMFERAGVAPGIWLPSVFIPAGTRRRVSFTAIRTGKDVTLGFNAYRSNDIEDLSICLLLTPDLEAVRSRLKPFLARILPENQVCDVALQDVDGAIELVFTGDFGSLSFAKMDAVGEMSSALGLARVGWKAKPFDRAETLLSPEPVRKIFGKLKVDIPPAAFLQPSREGEAALVAAVLAGCKGLKKAKFADLFAGCGTFSGHLLEKGTVYAAESDAASVEVLKKAAASHPKGLQVEKRDLFKEPLTVKEMNGFDCVVFDPPRAGAQAVCEVAARSKCPRLIGVSCNPSSFIRDARELVKGGYVLESVQIIDQFIWSSHTELVGVFSKGAA